MNALEQRGPKSRRPLFSALSLCLAVSILSLTSQAVFAQDQLEDYAQIYVDRYFEPSDDLKLSLKGADKAKALAHFSMGRSLESKGKIEPAIASFQKVLELQPHEVGLVKKTATLLAKTGQHDEARKLLATCLEENPNNARAYIIFSQYLATFRSDSAEDRKKALELAKTAVERFPSEAQTYDHLVKLHLVSGQKEEARAAMNVAIERDEKDPNYWLQIAGVASKVWPVRTKEGVEPVLINKIYDKALAAGGKDPKIRERVGDYYHASRQPKKALELYLGIIDEAPDRLDVREKLARVYGALGEEDKVIETLKSIVEINPQDARTHKDLGRIYVGREDNENAIFHFMESLKIAKGTAAEYDGVGVMMIRADQDEEAANLLERAAYLFPKNPRFPFLLSMAYGGLDRWEDAVKQCEETELLAKESNDQMLDEFFYYRYGAAAERAGDLDKAAVLLKKSIELISDKEPDDDLKEFTAQVYNYLGYMWIDKGLKLDEAGELIKTALRLNPNSGAIVDSLGWYHFKKGDYESAKRELLRSASMLEDPDADDNYEIYDHIGQTYFQLGMKEEAISNMEKAAKMKPDDKDIAARLKKFRETDPPVPAPEKKKEDATKKPAASDDKSEKEEGAPKTPEEAPAKKAD